MPKKSIKSFVKKISDYNSGWHRATFKLTHGEGLHTRPAAQFVKIAQQFPAEIEVHRGGLAGDGKSILSLLALGAKKGQRLTLWAKGLKAKEALQALGRFIRSLAPRKGGDAR